jgi:hypothetical protein
MHFFNAGRDMVQRFKLVELGRLGTGINFSSSVEYRR